jgi:hypothetical protein
MSGVSDDKPSLHKMQLDQKYQPPSAPRLIRQGLPEAELAIASSISSNLRSLSTEATNIAAAITLFGFSLQEDNKNAGPAQRGSLWPKWMGIAARDGAMSIRNFGEALAKIRALIGKTPTWLPHIDTKSLGSKPNQPLENMQIG